MPDFDNYNKQVKKKYEDAFKEVCDDLMKKEYDYWIIEGIYIFHKAFPGWHKEPNLNVVFDHEGNLDINSCEYYHPEKGLMDIGYILDDYLGECDMDIRLLTDTPYNKLLEVLHPIWIDKKIPLLEKTAELEKAFNKFLYGGSIEKTIKEKSDQQATKSILPAPEGTRWEEVKIRITEEGKISLKVKGIERTYSSEDFIKLIKLKNYLKEIFLKTLHAQHGIIEENESKNFKQNISDLRRVFKDAFGITDDPIPSHEAKTYKAKFLTQSDLGKSSSTNNDLSP